MADSISSSRFLVPGQLGSWLLNRSPIWQKNLLSARELGRFAKARGIDFDEKDIARLWQNGIIRADLILSKDEWQQQGLILLGQDSSDLYTYADVRKPKQRKQGWYNADLSVKPPPESVQLLFHPFRYYVLYHIDRVLELHMSKMQIFRGKYYVKLLKFSLSFLKEWSSSFEGLDRIAYWNDVVDLTVATEPCNYADIAGHITYSGIKSNSEEEQQRVEQERVEQWQDVRNAYEQIGEEHLKSIHNMLCVDAELLEPNKKVHTLLRLTGERIRDSMKGPLGGALIIRAMAELLRRASEETFKTVWLEEDESGLGWVPKDLKMQLYGSNRLLDGDARVASRYVNSLDLDYRVKIRWYVEGPTEWGALTSVFDAYPELRIQIVNLRGKFVQKDLLAFQDSLKIDDKEGVYSLISLDGDRSDYLSVVRRAAEQNIFLGLFFVSNPDFEIHNFDPEELKEIFWEMAVEYGALSSEREQLHNGLAGIERSGEALMRAARRSLPILNQIRKGEDWGRRLMSYAEKRPQKQDGQTRPIIRAINDAVAAHETDYHGSRQRRKVNPITGQTTPI